MPARTNGRRLTLAGIAAVVVLVGPVPVASRPLPAASPAAPATHERLLPLTGANNFRDLGGYPGADGRSVKWNTLFRSGSMHGLTPADFAYLESRGIRTVCDFRDSRERAAGPVNWPEPHAPTVLSDDYTLDTANFMPAGSPGTWTPASVQAVMAASYPRMLEQFNGQYRRMFAELLAHRVPLAFNCSAGKDRTGIAAALVLTALGVPRETVIEDYLATNRYLDAARLASTAGAMPGPLAKLPPEVLKPMLAADRSYIEAALQVVDAHPGGASGYLRDELGVSAAGLTRLRQLYLE